MSARVKVLLVCLPGIAAALAVGVFSQIRIDDVRDERKQELLYLPSQQLMEHFTLGMNSILSDLLWIQCVQYTGRELRSTHDFKWINQMVNTTVALDPYFVEAYRFGGMFLAALNAEDQAALDVLHKGIKHNPYAWELPYEAAMIYLLNRRGDPGYRENALFYLGLCLATGNAPQFVHKLYEGIQERIAANIENECANIAFERDMYQRMLESGEQLMEDLAKQKLQLLNLRANACQLQRIVDEFERRTGNRPESLETLQRAGVLKELPQDPQGGHYFIGPDGQVYNTTVLDNRAENLLNRIKIGIRRYRKQFGECPRDLNALRDKNVMTHVPVHPHPSKSWNFDPETCDVTP